MRNAAKGLRLLPGWVREGDYGGVSVALSDRGFEPGRDVVERRDTPHRRICVLVLGMHRSGTSALTRVLSLLGAELPKTLIGSGKGNDTGHWEPARLVALHDQTLKEIGSRWDDWRAIDLGALAEHRRHQLREEIGSLMLEEYGTAPLLVVKDPRICRFAPLYIDVLADLGIEPRFVLPLRNPLAVMASLGERDNMTPGFAALLWLRHVLDAEAATRSLPRAIVSYEALLADWHPVMRTVAAKTGLRWPRSPEVAERDISAFLIKELQHFAPTRRELSARKDITGWVKDAYRALLEIEKDADNEAVLAVFDRVRAEFDAACPAFGAAILQELAARESQAAEATARHQRTKEDLALLLKLRTDDIESLRAELSARDQEIGGLNATVRGGVAEIADLKSLLSRRDARIAGLETAVADLGNQLAAQGEAKDGEIAGLKIGLARLEAEMSKLSMELTSKDRRVADLRIAADARQAENTALKLDGDELRARTSAAEHEASMRGQHVRELRAALEQHQQRLLTLETSKSWRLTGPLRSAYSCWIAATRRLRRLRSERPQLSCLHEIEHVGGGTYVSFGGDPQLRLQTPSSGWPRGWIAVRWTIRRNSTKPPTSVLYVDYGQEIVAETARYKSEQGEIICALGDRVHALRFDPLEEPGTFELHNFTVIRLGWPSAGVLLAYRLLQRDRSMPHLLELSRSSARAFAARGRRGIGAELLRQYRGLSQSQDLDRIWRIHQSTLRSEVLPRLAQELAQLPHKPLISVVVATYNTPAPLLHEMISSVQEQVYDAWELVIVDDASTKDHVREILEANSSTDSRIRLRFAERNNGVAATLNRALALASGEYVAFMDHDDLLQPHALMRIAQCVLADAPDMIYSDEVIVSEDRATVLSLAVRPSFSQEYLRGHPYIVHLVAFRRAFLNLLGGFDDALRISQDYDLILRAAEVARKIVHIPEVLYQWRLVKTSLGHQLQHRVTDVSCTALTRHLLHSGEAASVQPDRLFNFYDVRYHLSADSKIAVVIPTKNNGKWVKRCIESIQSTVTDVNYSIMIVDHQSSDANTLAYLESLKPSHRVERFFGDFNFSRINNWAVCQLPAEFTHFLFCNNDIEAIEPGWLERMLELAQKHDVGAVGAKLLYPCRDIVQHGGVGVGLCGPAEHYGKWAPNLMPDRRTNPGYVGALLINREVSAVTAACMLVRRDAFESVGGFDEQFAVGFGDVDLCLRMRSKGYRVVMCPRAVLTHHESLTRGKSYGEDTHPTDTALFASRWANVIRDGDSYFNPHFDTASTAWEFRDPLPCHAEFQRRVWSRPQPPAATELAQAAGRNASAKP